MKRLYALLLLPAIMAIGTRALATTYTVNVTTDAGAAGTGSGSGTTGDLRYCIVQANANAGADIINFSTSGPVTLASALPSITSQITIDGTTATSYAAGTPSYAVKYGGTIFNITSAASAVVIKGLELNSGAGAGGQSGIAILSNGCAGLTIQNCTVVRMGEGFDVTGGSDATITNNIFSAVGSGGTGSCIKLDGVAAASITSRVAVSGNNFIANSGYYCYNGIYLLNMPNQVIGDNLTNVPTANILLPDGSLANIGNGYHVLRLDNMTNCTVDNIDVSFTTGANIGNTGIITYSCAGLVVKNCVLATRGGGLNVNNGSDVQVLNNTFKANGTCIGLASVASVSLPGGVAMSGNDFTTLNCGSALSMSGMKNESIGDATTVGANIILADGSLSGVNGNTLGLVNDTNVTVNSLDIIYGGASNHGSYGIQATGCGNLIIQNSTFTKTGAGLYVINGYDLQVLNNIFSNAVVNNYTVRIDKVQAVSVSKGLSMSGNTFTGTTSSTGNNGVRIDNMKNQVIGDNLTNVPTANVLLPDGSLNSIYGTVLELNTDTSTLVDNLNLNYATNVNNGTGLSANGCRFITVQNCNAYNHSNGIAITSGADAQVLNNVLAPSNGTCLQFNSVASVSLAKGVLVTGNTFPSTPQSQNGLIMQNMSGQVIGDNLTNVPTANVLVPDGSFNGCNNLGIYLFNMTNTKVDNIDFGWTFNTTATGTGFYAQSCAGTTVKNSTTNLRSTGLRFYQGSDDSVLNNTFSNSGTGGYTLDFDGVAAVSIPKRIWVTGNTYSSGTNGIQLQNMSNQIIGPASVAGANVVIPAGSFSNFIGTSAILRMISVNNSTVDNLDASYTGAGNSGIGIYTTGCSTLLVQNTTTNKRNYNLTFDGGSDLQVLNNTIGTSNNRALYIANYTAGVLPRAIIVTGNTFGTGSDGVQLYNMKNQRIGDGTASSTVALGATPNVVFADGDLKNYNNRALYMDNIDSTIIDNIDFALTTGTGYAGIFDNNSSDVLTIQNCRVGNQSIGMYFQNGSEKKVLNDTFANCGTSGQSALYFTNVGKGLAVPRYINVTGNSFTGGNNGIRIDNIKNQIIGDAGVAGANVVIADGSINSFTAIPLFLNNVDSSVVDNLNISTASGTGTEGIYLSGGNDVIKVQNCTVSNRNRGITVGGGSELTVIGDTLTNCGLTSYAIDINGVGATVNMPRRIAVSDIFFNGCTNGYALQNMSNLRVGDKTIAGANVVIAPESKVVTMSGNPLYMNNTWASRIDHVNLSYQGTGISGVGLNLGAAPRDTVNQIIICSRNVGIDASDSAQSFTSNSVKNCNTGLRHNNPRTVIPVYVKLNTFEANTYGISNSSAITMNATNNYWNGATPVQNSTNNGYTGPVTVTPVLAAEDPSVQLNKGTIVLSTHVLSGFTASGCVPGTAQTFTASGQCIETSSVLLTAPAGFQFSLNGTTYAGTVTLPVSAGGITGQPKTVYVRINPAAGPGSYNDTVQATAVYTNPPLLRLSGNVDAANAAVTGNSVTVQSGASTTSAGNDTYFASTLNGDPVSKTYTITNNGTQPMSIGTVTITGANAADFSVTMQPAATVAVNSSTTFTVAFNPAALTGNTRTAVVHVPSNACSTTDYNFTVQGCIPALASSNLSETHNVSNDIYGGVSCVNLIARVQPAGASPVSGSVSATVTIDGSVQSYSGQYYAQRHYDIEPATNAGAATATLTLYFTQAEFDAYNVVSPGTVNDLPTGPNDAAGKTNVQIWQYHGTSASGTPGTYSGAMTQIDPPDANVVYNNEAGRWEVTFPVNGFSGFFLIGLNPNPLPIKLLAISAGKAGGHSNRILWQTGVESPGAGFVLERSANAAVFSALSHTIPGQGSNTSYKYFDDQPLDPISYYRIKMTEAGGEFTYSNIVAVQNSSISGATTVTPNPAHGTATLVFANTPAAGTAIRLLNNLGQVVRTCYPGIAENVYQLDLSGIAAGNYMISISQGGQQEYLRLLVK